jgi:hypothetical protein
MVLFIFWREQVGHEQVIGLIEIKLKVFDANVGEVARRVDVEPL